MPTGRRVLGRRDGAAGFALPLLLLVLAVAAIAAAKAEIPLSYRLAREREDELHFRARAYVSAIRSFWRAEEDVRRRRLPTSFEDLERDPRFAQKRHLRRRYSDPLARKPDTPFRIITGSPGPGLPQGMIGVASTADTPLLRRAGLRTGSDLTLGVKVASDLEFQVDLQELAGPPRNAPGAVLPPRPPASEAGRPSLPSAR